MVILLMVSIVLVLWSVSFYAVLTALTQKIPRENLPDFGGMATLFFGVSGLGLVLFSLFFGGVAIIGWQSLKNELRKDIEAATLERISTLEKELRGRVLTIIGFMIGELHSNPDRLEQDEHKDFLSEAVWYCRKGYEILKDVEAKGKNMALNNLVYYTCLYGEELKCDLLLKQARRLREIGQEYDYAACLLTYCRVVLQCSSDTSDMKDAYSIATGVLRMKLTERQKKEATFYVTSLAAKVAAPPGIPAKKEH